ncbi:MAG: glucosaminidase domain-containing protein [Bacilli bacterium]|nr:glucosaminidase domain-containing protein [Bacilli bacterium]MBQ8218704.1 glucosaminidase domain-containing protein [Bacilli bacterium]
MKKFIVTILTIMLVFSMIFSHTTTVNAANYELSEEQLEIADRIAEICTERWEESGVLPSVCIAQAYLESHIGTYCYPNNLWGLHGGYKSYETLDDGINAYIDCINNGYYDNALWHTDPEYVINAIYDGGYCTTDKAVYTGNIMWIIEEFDLTRYDATILRNCNMKTYESCVTWKQIK